MSLRLAVFDCDGTLVDGQAAVCNAMDAAFAAHGLPRPDHHLVRRSVGLSLPQAVRALVPEADDALRQGIDLAYRNAFRAAREAGQLVEPLYAGVRELLDGLREQGWLLGVATGKSDRGLDLCLRHHGLRDRFITLQTADRHPSKPHPSMVEQAMADAGAAPHTTVMIGDTSFDMAMGVAAGARSLGVSWGYHPVEELWAAGAYHVTDHPDFLMEALA